MSNYIYRFIDNQENIVYIGKTKDLKKRLTSHNHLSEGDYKEVTRVECVNFENEKDMDFAERYYISKHKPKFNTVFKNNNDFDNNKELDEIFSNHFKTCCKIAGNKIVDNNAPIKTSYTRGEHMNIGTLFILLIGCVLGLYGNSIDNTVFIALIFMFIGIYIGQNFIIVFKPKDVMEKSKKIKSVPKNHGKLNISAIKLEDNQISLEKKNENDFSECNAIEDTPSQTEAKEPGEENTLVFEDELTEAVLQNIIDSDCKISASLIQRKFRVGFNRASRIFDELERFDLISEGNTFNRFILLDKAAEIGFFKSDSSLRIDELNDGIEQQDINEKDFVF